jgi:hypothetical protein
MEQLLVELELARGGLTNEGKGLEGAPPRQSTFVLRGEIDERTSTEGNRILLRAELFDVASQEVKTKAEWDCSHDQISVVAAEIAEHMARAALGEGADQLPVQNNDGDDVDALYRLALGDVFRFIRINTDSGGYVPFSIPGVDSPYPLHHEVDPDSPLGAHLLKKSIDRLESVLFIRPEQLTAALPLAYCLSFHVDGVWRPEQCERLLRRIRAESTDAEMRDLAGHLLADLYFTHRGCIYSDRQVAELDPELVELGYQRRLEMLIEMAQEDSSRRWGYLYDTLFDICEFKQENERWQELFDAVVQIVEHTGKQHRLARGAASLSFALVRNQSVAQPLKDEAMQLLIDWQQGDDDAKRLHSAKYLYLLDRLSPQEYVAAIDGAYRNQPGVDSERALAFDRVWLARHRLAKGDPEFALEILASYQPKDHTQESYDFSYGEYGFLLGECYERMGRRQEALATYLHYAPIPSGYAHGGNIDFEGRIKALGGVPLDENRDIEVRYLDQSFNQPLYCRVLATDGIRLFSAGGFENGRLGEKAVPIRSVRAVRFDTGEWTNLGGPDDRVSCMAVAGGHLWAGTDRNGLWRMELESGAWRKWTTEVGLPTNSLLAVAAQGPVAWASVGNIDAQRNVVSGGVVRIDPGVDALPGSVRVYRDRLAPQTAPAALAIDGNKLVATGLNYSVSVLDLAADCWQILPEEWAFTIAAGDGRFWIANRRVLASALDASGREPTKFLIAELFPGFQGAFRLRFLVEHEGQLWFGGPAWRKLDDAGLFRLDLATGQLKRYGPREGFRYAQRNSYECYDAVWAKDRLWIATTFGLAEVRLRSE